MHRKRACGLGVQTHPAKQDLNPPCCAVDAELEIGTEATEWKRENVFALSGFLTRRYLSRRGINPVTSARDFLECLHPGALRGQPDVPASGLESVLRSM